MTKTPESDAPHAAQAGASGEVSEAADASADGPLFSSPGEALGNLGKLGKLRAAAQERVDHLDARISEGIQHAQDAGASQQDAEAAAGTRSNA